MNLTNHPVADLFPMMTGDELNELAADIKDRGLLQPIVLDGEGRILDGRNRHAACIKAGIEPVFDTYVGADPDGYALTVNVNRRHLKPGQRYIVTEQARRMATANGSRIPKKGFSDDKNDQNRLSDAAVALDFGAADLVPQIMSGGLALQEAAKIARERKQAIKEREQKVARLRKSAADLYDLVAEDRMDPDEAIAALEAREEKARAEASEREQAEQRAAEEHQRECRDATQFLCQIVVAMARVDGAEAAAKYNPAEVLAGRPVSLTVIDDAMDSLEQLRGAWVERELG